MRETTSSVSISRQRWMGVVAVCAFACALLFNVAAHAGWVDTLPADAPAEQKQLFAEFDKLQWEHGPKKVMLRGNADLQLPEGYVYLAPKDTQRFLELNHNIGGGDEVLIAPEDLAWMAYLSYLEEGYVKDDEEIDADAILQTLKDATEAANEERRSRGWGEMHVVGWATPPAYNRETKRLEWAARHQSADGEGVNFFTKMLGRRGHMSVQMVGDPEALAADERDLNTVLEGFRYNAGDRYADYKPGDKVAEYGLAAMVVGGAAAVATKKGLLPAIGAFLAAAWKAIAALVIAAFASLRRFFGKKQDT